MDTGTEVAFPLALVIFIVPIGSADGVFDACKMANALGRYAFKGQGTAARGLLEKLGVVNDLDIVFCITFEDSINALIRTAVYRLEMDKPSKGIVFAIPISSPIGKRKREGETTIAMVNKTNEETLLCTQELVVVQLSGDYSRRVMQCAQKAGALGGTLIQGRACADSAAVKFLNITVAPQCDILFMLAPKDASVNVLEAVISEYGSHTPACASGFILPVLMSTVGAHTEAGSK